MDRRLPPLLLALPLLVGVAALQGLTVEVDTFHGSDARVYHLPTILQFSERIDLARYPAAQTPLYHLLFAGYGELVGFELWKLRLLNVLLSYGAALAVYALLRRRLERSQALALALLVELSPYVLGASFTLLTDNLALLFGALALLGFDRFRSEGSLPTFALACLAMAAAVQTRQSFLWLGFVAVWALLLGPARGRERAAGAAAGALALAPLAALVVAWGGLVPAGADPASCGLCTDRPGVGRDALTLRTVAFTIALLGLYATAIYTPILARRLRPAARDLTAPIAARARALAPRPRDLLLALAAGVGLLLLAPLAYAPPVPGEPGDAGYLWRIADALPELAGPSLAFWPLVPLGVLALLLLVRRSGAASLPAVWFAGFLVAALPVGLVYQKYFDPFALFALALLARPEDLRTRLDYAGVAALGVAFVAYALSFAG